MRNITFIYYAAVKNYLYAIQLKGTQGAKAWPVLRLVKLELKGSVQLLLLLLLLLLSSFITQLTLLTGSPCGHLASV